MEVSVVELPLWAWMAIRNTQNIYNMYNLSCIYIYMFTIYIYIYIYIHIYMLEHNALTDMYWRKTIKPCTFPAV